MRREPYISLRNSLKNVVKSASDVVKSEQVIVNDLNFMFCPYDEFIETMISLSKDQQGREQKYPVVAFITDIEETRGESRNVYSSGRMRFFIATITSQGYTAEQRHDKVIIPTLVPIYSELLLQFAKSTRFIFSDNLHIPHNKIERYSWGRTAAITDGQTIDFIDAIEITNFEFNLTSYNEITNN